MMIVLYVCASVIQIIEVELAIRWCAVYPDDAKWMMRGDEV